LLVGLCLLVLPWSSNSIYPCYLESGLLRKIAVPSDAPVQEVFVRQGDRVDAGRTLFRLDPVRLQFKLKDNKAEVQFVRKEMWIIEKTEKDLSKLELKIIELSQAEDAVRQTEQDLLNLEWNAPFAGFVTSLAADLQPGDQPGKGTVVGEFAAEGKYEVRGILPEDYVDTVRPGHKVEVWFPMEEGMKFTLTVREVNPFKADDLEASSFSSRFGGEIATEVREGIGKDVPLNAYYLAKIDFPDGSGIPLGTTGRLVVHQPPRSLLTRMIGALYGAFHREILF
jgi:putative peptide zinc metalloprotease protein